MKQVVQDQSAGQVSVIEVPAPILQARGLLVRTVASVISSGTERAKIEMGERSLLGKARARPDLVRKVMQQAKNDGLRSTVDLVRDRLGMPQPLGYSAAGVVLEVGALADGFEPGDMVAMAGAGYANHAEVNYIPANLAAPLPDGLSPEEASFATIGSIALHGIRQANLSHGELVVVSGLGLIGQLTARLLRGYGHPVIGVDPSPVARDEVRRLGVETMDPADPTLQHLAADAVLLTASTSKDGPIRNAPTWCRDRGRVVVVGDVGLSLMRPPYYDGEVDLRFSRSYGPGRYDVSYEEEGVDYPIGYVRWTEGRNLREFLRVVHTGLVEVLDLVDARYDISEATAAYNRLAHGERARALLLNYGALEQPNLDDPSVAAPRNLTVAPRPSGRVGVSMCGAGNFARKVLIPALEQSGRVQWGVVSSASGISARHVADTKGFVAAVDTAYKVMAHPSTDAVVIATRHDTHGSLAALAVENGKPAYVEKPVAVTAAELDELEQFEARNLLVTGYNRRRAAATVAAVSAMTGRTTPLIIQMRVNAGRLPRGHWADSAEQGGRIVGELCHFIDLACHLSASGVARVTSVSGGRRQPAAEDTLQTLMEHRDGSVSSIAYFANGSKDLPKERIEAHWEDNSWVVDDFRQYWLDTGSGIKRHRLRRQDKGHEALVREFVAFAAGTCENPVPFHQSAHVTRVTHAVVNSLATGNWISLPPVNW